MRFKDKVAIVTGGACGIGQAIARGLAREGAQVVILDRLQEEGEANASHIRAEGGRAVAMTVDAVDAVQVNQAVAKIAEQFGRIDVLINNIGSTEVIPFLESDEGVWRKSVELNFMVPLRFCSVVLPYMVKQKSGSVVNISSGSARQAVPLAVVYSAAKAAVIAMNRSLALAMAPHNIRLNCVLPGTVGTPEFKRAYEADPAHINNLLKQVTLGRPGRPEEVAAAVLFLASDDASYMTGQAVSCDGGRVML
jgi:meso-butanediol dehydrogenase / (S,S)-butanediol dehydrogenase / diacetyl reductase